MTVEILVFCGWWFSNQFDVVSETHLSCDTVGRELWLAMLNSLVCPETDRNIRIEKQGYVECFIPDINQCVNSHFDTGKRWIF